MLFHLTPCLSFLQYNIPSTCSKCGFQAQLPETELIFRCPVSTCGFESCRHCGDEPHIPLKCSEVESKDATKGRLRVEEAITNAKIRTSPKCSNKFVKESGCNKMTCSCRTRICYICRAVIQDYTHFCQAPHCDHSSCGKCRLYSNAEEDDKLAMRDAGIKAAEAVRGESLLSASTEVNVEDILQAGVTTTARQQQPAAAARRQPVAAARRQPRTAGAVAIRWGDNWT